MIGRVALVSGLMVLCVSSAVGDERTEPIDMVIALDKSLSMEEEIGAVREEMQRFIDEQLIVGDHLHLLLFYGNADVLLSQEIASQDVHDVVDGLFSHIKANGRFTDIGNALDSLRGHLLTRAGNERRKYVLLVTDGKQEAPPGSPYSSPDGTFDHEYLRSIVQTFPFEGWDIHVIGVGDQTVARQVAEGMAASFDQVDSSESADTPLAEQIAEVTRDLLARVDVQELTITPVGRSGRANARLTLIPNATEESQEIRMRAVELASALTGTIEVLAEPTTVVVGPDGETTVDVPLMLPTGLELGNYTGTVAFAFADGAVFTPGRFEVEYRVRSFWQEFWWAIVLAAAAIGVIVVGGLLALLARAKASTIAFRLSVENQRRSQEVFRARTGTPLYVAENDDEVYVAEERNAKALLELTAGDDGLKRKVIKASALLDPESAGGDAFGPPVRVRLTSGRRTSVRLIKAE